MAWVARVAAQSFPFELCEDWTGMAIWYTPSRVIIPPEHHDLELTSMTPLPPVAYSHAYAGIDSRLRRCYLAGRVGKRLPKADQTF